MQNIIKSLDILITCWSYSWGGLEMFSLETAKHLSASGMRVKIMCSAGSRLEEESYNSGFKTLPYFSKNINILSSIGKLKKYLKLNKADIIHSNHSHDLWVLTPALRLSQSNAKLFLTKHMASGIKKNDMLHKFLYKRLNGIFAISEYIKNSVSDTCPVPLSIVHMLPVGIDLNRFNPSRFDKSAVKKEYNLPSDKLIIGIMGRMTPGKGHEEFLEAAKIINNDHLSRVHFAVIGNASFGEESYEEDIKSLAKKINIVNITFAGFTPEPERLMCALDILAFPSHNESFGRVLLEAMALKIPVVASGNAGVLDIVIDNETGLLFEPKDPVSLAKKLTMLIESDTLRSVFAENGYKRVKDKFTFEIMTDKLMKFYTS